MPAGTNSWVIPSRAETSTVDRVAVGTIVAVGGSGVGVIVETLITNAGGRVEAVGIVCVPLPIAVVPHDALNNSQANPRVIFLMVEMVSNILLRDGTEFIDPVRPALYALDHHRISD